jgi:putative IMPACT (imprinted ancient) family translation regulator
MDSAMVDEATPRLTLAGPGRAELVVRRSRFLAHAARVEDPTTLTAWLAEVRHQHPEAHHCPHAWCAWDGTSRTSDDGEPPGTGGRPCLGAVTRAGLRATAVAVARIFGGMQLGAANLGRAYAQAADLAVAAAGVRTLHRWQRLSARVGYGEMGALERALAQAGARDLVRSYDAGVSIRAWVQAPAAQRLIATLPRVAWHLEAEEWR